MKIVKKVLALVMTVAMIASLTAMAFAAQKPAYDFSFSTPDADGVVTATLFIKNAEGVATGEININFDPSVLQFAPAGKASKFTPHKNYSDLNAAGNGALNEVNAENASEGKIAAVFLFTNLLGDFDEYDVDADINRFGIFVMKFKVLKKNVDAKLSLTGKITTGDDEEQVIHDFSGSFVVAKAAGNTPVTPSVTEDPSVTEKPNTNNKGDDKTNEKDNTPVVTKDSSDKIDSEDKTIPDTGSEQPTGDNMVLAATAGVVVLAGAAFVLSKKRK